MKCHWIHCHDSRMWRIKSVGH